MPATAVSDTKFVYQGAQFEFVKDGHGTVDGMVAHIVEGDLKAVRKRRVGFDEL